MSDYHEWLAMPEVEAVLVLTPIALRVLMVKILVGGVLKVRHEAVGLRARVSSRVASRTHMIAPCHAECPGRRMAGVTSFGGAFFGAASGSHAFSTEVVDLTFLSLAETSVVGLFLRLSAEAGCVTIIVRCMLAVG
jgi:hypothetical protein